VSECLAPKLRARRERFGVSLWGVPSPCWEGKEVSRVEDEKRKKVTLWEAAEYLDLTPGKVQDMVERGVLRADKFAGAIHIPREEVERIERETAP
jgi:excisionase family DNA binding protein